MVEQVSVARESLGSERQAQRTGTRAQGEIARAGADRAGTTREAERAVGDIQNALVAGLADEPVEAPNEIRLRVERDVDRVVAEVVDRETGEVVHEIPPEDMIAAAKTLEAMLGRVLDREA